MTEKVKKKRTARKTKTSAARGCKARPGGKSLVIVESPAKSKTINKILGSDFKVMASMGHLIDLPEDRMGIDFEKGFEPEYKVIKGRNKFLQEIKNEAKTCKAVYLAADPDREGEAISWHLKNQIEKLVPEIYRVRFEEITEKAVRAAFAQPDRIEMNKVNAQQARRVLDRIVGYSISPILWKKIARGLSAGRVQSVAVRLVVEREEEILRFVPEEYWSVDALLRKTATADGCKFRAKLLKYKGEKIHVKDKEQADKIVADLKSADYFVSDVSRKEKRSYPRSPYTTSLLQQDAFNKLNFSSSKTMKIAQKLYEGVDIGEEGSVGLITYMRTDSVKVSDDAAAEARKYITEKYGAKYYPEQPHVYKSKKRAQEAHESIRPTLPFREPAVIARFLDEDEKKLYKLIWNRFMASQMANAVYSVLAVTIDAGDYKLRAGGADLIFDGFLSVYQGASPFESEEEDMGLIPPLVKGDGLSLVDLLPEQHFTKAPPRYNDASLVKVLEEKGIGRPSTYAPIIRTIIDRNYIKRMGKVFQPTELGILVTKLLVQHFQNVVDYEFTAKMETALDGVEEGQVEWTGVIKEFYDPFMKTLAEAKEKIKDVNKEEIRTGDFCPLCNRHMIVKWGRKGRFLSCSGFPECRYSKSITTGVKCPVDNCGGELVERRSRRGAFYGCTSYPKCTYTARNLNPPKTAGEDNAAAETGIPQVED
jgi:DNA topoisomerase-1